MKRHIVGHKKIRHIIGLMCSQIHFVGGDRKHISIVKYDWIEMDRLNVFIDTFFSCNVDSRFVNGLK